MKLQMMWILSPWDLHTNTTLQVSHVEFFWGKRRGVEMFDI